MFSERSMCKQRDFNDSQVSRNFHRRLTWNLSILCNWTSRWKAKKSRIVFWASLGVYKLPSGRQYIRIQRSRKQTYRLLRCFKTFTESHLHTSNIHQFVGSICLRGFRSVFSRLWISYNRYSGSGSSSSTSPCSIASSSTWARSIYPTIGSQMWVQI